MNPYIGEIRQVGFTFAPTGWLVCNGQLVSISQYDALYNLLGTTYGGDGQSTFGLPDLRGRAPLGQGTGQSVFPIGNVGGQENVTLTQQQLPSHTHPIAASTAAATSRTPQASVFGTSNAFQQYGTTAANGTTAPMLTPTGGNQPHANLMPYLCLNFIIATEGVYPSS